MLHVKIDLVPFGQDNDRRQISEIYIGNVGYATKGKTKYHVYLEDPRKGPVRQVIPDAVALHKREDGAEVLVMLAIKALKRKKV